MILYFDDWLSCRNHSCDFYWGWIRIPYKNGFLMWFKPTNRQVGLVVDPTCGNIMAL